jgi:DNA-3-methyladenine glycosylase II
MTRFIHTQAELETAVDVLVKQDRRWEPVFAKTGMPALRRREGGYAGLCSIVCGQQVSTASAAAIRGRLFAAFG